MSKKTLSLFFVALLSAAFQAKGITYGQLAERPCFGQTRNSYYSMLINLGLVNPDDHTYIEARDESFDNADLSGLDFRGSRFYRCNFSGAKLTHANLDDVSLARCNLTLVDFSGASLVNTGMQRSNCGGSRFFQANLCRSNLTHTSFIYADLSGVDLSTARINETNFSHADLRGAKFSTMTERKNCCGSGMVPVEPQAGYSLMEGAYIVGAIGFDVAFRDAKGTPIRTLAEAKAAGLYVSDEDLSAEKEVTKSN